MPWGFCLGYKFEGNYLFGFYLRGLYNTFYLLCRLGNFNFQRIFVPSQGNLFLICKGSFIFLGFCLGCKFYSKKIISFLLAKAATWDLKFSLNSVVYSNISLDILCITKGNVYNSNAQVAWEIIWVAVLTEFNLV